MSQKCLQVVMRKRKSLPHFGNILEIERNCLFLVFAFLARDLQQWVCLQLVSRRWKNLSLQSSWIRLLAPILTCTNTQECVQKCVRLPGLTSIAVLTSLQLAASDFEYLSHSQSLISCEITCSCYMFMQCRCQMNKFFNFSQCVNLFSKLRTLKLIGCQPFDMSVLHYLPDLQILGLCNSAMVLSEPSCLPASRNLINLDLSAQDTIHVAMMEQVCEADDINDILVWLGPSLANVTDINLEGRSMVSSRAMKILQYCRNMEKFVITSDNVNDEDMQLIADCMPNLKSVSICSRISLHGLYQLAKLKKLVELGIGGLCYGYREVETVFELFPQLCFTELNNRAIFWEQRIFGKFQI
jgi:hypothetical protein